MSFAHPYLLLLLLLLPLLAMAAVLASRHKRKQWQEFVADRLRSRLINRASVLPRVLAFTSLLAAIACLILGISRLQYQLSAKTESTRGRNLIILLDLSRSMQATDLKPSRLDQAKALIYELLETLPNDRIGVVGFSSSPFLFAPLTIDHSAVRETVEQLDHESIPTGGSDVAAAVQLAVNTLKETAQSNNGMLILSDGEEHSPGLLGTLEQIKQSGTYVFAVGIGTEEGSFIPDKNYPDGRFRDVNDEIVITRLQANTLREFAEQSGGRFALAQSASDIPQMVAAAVSDLESFELKGREKIQATELYQWCILPAIVLLMTAILLGTRWRPLARMASTGAALCVMSLLLQPAKAAEKPSLTGARNALETKDYKNAQQWFQQLADEKDPLSDDRAAMYLGKATADYRLKELAEARKSYSRALTAEDSAIRSAAHQGMGNTLFQLGWMELSDGSLYPGEEQAPQQFDELLQAKIKEWMEDDKTDAKEQSAGYRTLQTIMLNWADAVRHSQSALQLRPDNADAAQNGKVARNYLEKLRQKMEQQQQEMQAQMQGQGEQQGDQPGEGQGEGDQEGEGEGQPKDPKDGKGENEGDKDGDGKKDPDGKTPEGEKPDPKNTHGKDRKAGETKEEHALRKLNENADLQRGIVAPGRNEYRRPAKDW
jgi:Ca-activated chloride channel family protein